MLILCFDFHVQMLSPAVHVLVYLVWSSDLVWFYRLYCKRKILEIFQFS